MSITSGNVERNLENISVNATDDFFSQQSFLPTDGKFDFPLNQKVLTDDGSERHSEGSDTYSENANTNGQIPESLYFDALIKENERSSLKNSPESLPRDSLREQLLRAEAQQYVNEPNMEPFGDALLLQQGSAGDYGQQPDRLTLPAQYQQYQQSQSHSNEYQPQFLQSYDDAQYRQQDFNKLSPQSAAKQRAAAAAEENKFLLHHAQSVGLQYQQYPLQQDPIEQQYHKSNVQYPESAGQQYQYQRQDMGLDRGAVHGDQFGLSPTSDYSELYARLPPAPQDQQVQRQQVRRAPPLPGYSNQMQLGRGSPGQGNFLHGQQQLGGYPRSGMIPGAGGPGGIGGRGLTNYPKHMMHRPFNDLRHSKGNNQMQLLQQGEYNPQFSMYGGINTHQMQQQASYGVPRDMPMFNSQPAIYQIHFKLFHAYCCADASTVYNVNDFVFVEADRGETIGIIVAVVPPEQYRSLSALWGIKELKRILRLATVRDRMALPQKNLDEQRAAQLCYDKAVLIYKLPIVLYDAEFQYDRQKLTFLFSSKT